MYSANQIANWFLVRHMKQMSSEDLDESLTQMKLHKLLYYAQGIFLSLKSKRLFDEEIMAWQHGPVVYSIYNKYKGMKEIQYLLSEDQYNDYEDIIKNDEAFMILEFTFENYGIYSAGQLRRKTHSEKPWIEAWNETGGYTSISDSTMESYFKEKYTTEDIDTFQQFLLLDSSESEKLQTLLYEYYGENFEGFTIENYPNDSHAYVTVYDEERNFSENLEIFKQIKEEAEGSFTFLIGG